MPSDPSGRFPSGILTRHPADFFDDNVGVGGFWIQGSLPVLAPHWLQVGLFNNASTGIALKVYGLSVFAEGGGGAGLYSVVGTIGTFDHNCASVRFDLGAPFGQIYQQSQAGASGQRNPFQTGQPFATVGSSGFDSFTQFSPFPIAVIPPGFSLVATNLIFSDDVGFFFWYQQAVE